MDYSTNKEIHSYTMNVSNLFKERERGREGELTALNKKAAMDPKLTKEFMFGDPFLKALRPSTSKSASIQVILKFQKIQNIRCWSMK